jgi:hypothetical protein
MQQDLQRRKSKREPLIGVLSAAVLATLAMLQGDVDSDVQITHS